MTKVSLMKEKLGKIILTLLVIPYLLIIAAGIFFSGYIHKLTRPRLFQMFLYFLAGAFFISGCSPARKTDRPTAPNIILITIDALRADALSLYGNKYSTSPFLDRVARQGVYFSQAISSFYSTQPSMASLMTGKFPSFEGVKGWVPSTYYGFSRFRRPGEKDGMTSRVLTLAEVLKKAGYTTVGFNTNPFLLAKTNFGQGFDQYHDFEGYYKKARKLKVPLAYSCAAPVNVVLPEVLKWLEKPRSEPFFLWIHLMDVHFPYLPPPPYNRMFDWGFLDFDDLTLSKTYQALILEQHNCKLPKRFKKLDELGITKKQLVGHMKGLYQGELRCVDDYLQKLWKELEREKLLTNSLLVIASDHGEEFLEHGYLSHNGFTGGKEEQVRIPLIISFPEPGQAFHQQEVSALCRTVDITPTILDYAGVNKDGWKQMDGRSLIPFLKGAEPAGAVAWMSAPGFRMLRTPKWKSIKFRGDGGAELYNLERDPGEEDNLAPQNPRKAEEMQEAFQDIFRAIKAQGQPEAENPTRAPGATEPSIDRESRKRLRALGYAQ